LSTLEVVPRFVLPRAEGTCFMSNGRPEVSRVRRPLAVLLAVAVAGGGAFAGWLFMSGSTRLPPTRRQVATTAVATEDSLALAREVFLREPTLANSRTYLQQLNEYLQRHPEQLPPPPPEEAFAAPPPVLETGSGRLGMLKEDRDEIVDRTFTSTDAHYLEMCAFLADAVHTLPLEGLSDRDRAQVCFDWVMRQMPLHEGAPDYLPRHVLCRGRGTPFSRTLLCLATLERAGISSGLLTCLGPKVPFIEFVAVLADGSIYIFDTELGTAVHDTGRRAPASLAQLEEHPDWLKPIIEARGVEFDIRKRGIYPVWTAQAACPRMRVLEGQLRPALPLRLHLDIGALQQSWREAVKGPLLFPQERKLFSWPSQYWRSLMMTARAEEAAASVVDNPLSPPAFAFQSSIVPWEKLPRVMQESVPLSGAGNRLRMQFAAPFESFFLKPGGPRDLLVRGQLDKAAAMLVSIRDELQTLRRQARSDANLDETVAKWCYDLRNAQGNLLLAQSAVPRKAPDDPSLLRAQERVRQLWSKEQVAPVLFFLHASATEPLLVEVDYQLALCKHEQAERLQIQLDHQQSTDAAAVREVWRSAAEHWRKFLEEHPQAPGEGSARLLAARALEMTGDYAAALTLVQDPPAHLSAWDRRACLYRARLLKAAK
jgi:hypothetical protein